jgi:predicted nucleotide-binding protein (sugar kinase/HSP70/actin superfamily)
MAQNTDRVVFTKEMKKTHKILLPNMAPIHFRMLRDVFLNLGYDAELLQNESHTVVENGLKYVHNDSCYPALLVIGQMIDAIKSGDYDPDHLAVLITQTGGGCRASNYIHLLRKGLIKAGYPQIPVISLNISGLEENPGFEINLELVRKFIAGVVYGDMLMHLSNQSRPYEITKGQTDEMVEKWVTDIGEILNAGKGYSNRAIKKMCIDIVKDFANIQIKKENKLKAGIVGEIYVKYSPLANNHLEDFLKTQDVEVMIPGMMGFAIFKVDNRIEDIKLYGGNIFKKAVIRILYIYLIKLEKIMYEAIKNNSEFIPTSHYQHLKHLVKGVVGYGSKMGEGWLLTAEMMELTELGYGNIICTQPFGCLPNHINGKGMIRSITEIMPGANIVPIDYDPSATAVNQENRIKLMLSVGKENLEKKEKAGSVA